MLISGLWSLVSCLLDLNTYSSNIIQQLWYSYFLHTCVVPVYTPRCTRVVHLKVLFANMITATNNNNNTNISFIHLCN
jgi:hypothetical protein